MDPVSAGALLSNSFNWLQVIEIVINALLLLLLIIFSYKSAKANENLYRLAFEQDLLKRKEEHFNELKEHVIKPLLFKEYRENFNVYLFKDLTTYHYPELRQKIMDFIAATHQYENMNMVKQPDKQKGTYSQNKGFHLYELATTIDDILNRDPRDIEVMLKKQIELRGELGKLLRLPSKALKLVSNETCPYMKGKKGEEPTAEDRSITKELLWRLPERSSLL